MDEDYSHPQVIFRPTNPKERIIQINILRGFAMFGVLLVNVFGIINNEKYCRSGRHRCLTQTKYPISLIFVAG